MNDELRQRIIDRLKRGEDLPREWARDVFPPEKIEHELVYHGKEREGDILANTMAVPLQEVRTFGNNIGANSTNSMQDWHNMLILGDNLQVLKRLLEYKKEGRLCNADGTSGVRLVYIDPPFGTGDQYGGNNAEIAYSAKKQGTEFIDFVRRRLVILRELLADDGSICVRLDYHFGHYIKVVMDEIFGMQNFQNEIAINRVKRQLRNLTRLNVSTESIFFYSKSASFYFSNPESPRSCNFCGKAKDPIWDDMVSPGLRNPPERIILGKKYLPRRGRHFMYTQKKIDDLENLSDCGMCQAGRSQEMIEFKED